jgi:hypothetical protein
LLIAALSHVEGVPLLLQNHGGHNFYTWLDALPPALTWSWQQLASPQQRVLFPLADQTRSTATVIEPAVKHRKPSATVPTSRRNALSRRHP